MKINKSKSWKLNSRENKCFRIMRNPYNGEKAVFNKWCWENRTTICKRTKLDHFLTPYKKLNSVSPKARTTTIKINTWDHIKLNSLCNSKGNCE